MPEDLIQNLEFEETDLKDPELRLDICHYFERDGPLKFPAKSFAVAIIYAHLLAKYFEQDFVEALSDSDLFMGNDKFFHPYTQNSEIDAIYHDVFSFLSLKDLWDFEASEVSCVQKTVHYFKLEFLLTEE